MSSQHQMSYEGQAQRARDKARQASPATQRTAQRVCVKLSSHRAGGVTHLVGPNAQMDLAARTS